MRALFEADLFAPVALIKGVLPGMRARRRGHIVNVSSIGGFVTCPGVAHYHMVKFGVEALSDALAKEVAPLGIGVTPVAPGAFRTDFRRPASMVRQRRGSTTTPTPRAARAPLSGPDTASSRAPPPEGRAVIAAVEAEQPPMHLLIGGDALDQFRAKLDDMRREIDARESVTRGTDFRAVDVA